MDLCVRGDAVEVEVGCGEAGQFHAYQGDGVGPIIGDHHRRADLGHVAAERSIVGEERGGEIDDVVAAAGRREVGDGIGSETGVEIEGIRAQVAGEAVRSRPSVQNIVPTQAGKDIGAGAAGEGIVVGRPGKVLEVEEGVGSCAASVLG